MDRKLWNEILKHGAYSQELDWFAYDKNRSLAVFTATQNAPIPNCIKESFENYNILKQNIDLLPKMSKAQLVTSENGSYEDWIAYAEKGLFAFDFPDVHRKIKLNQYDLIAKPITPRKIDDLNISENILRCIYKFDFEFATYNIRIEEII